MSSGAGPSSAASIERSDRYRMAIEVVTSYVRARDGDFPPDASTSQVLAMDGPVGRMLCGAFKTLYMHGRFSRTMVELALVHSKTSFHDYVELWMRSLPPKERSRYTAELYNSNFAGVKWDDAFYDRCMLKDSPASMPAPPVPLGDHRHTAKRGKIGNAASLFHQALNTGFLFDTLDLKDYQSPLSGTYEDMLGDDVLAPPLGPLFGIQKSELVFGTRSDGGGTRTVSPSERVLRCWNVMYYSGRLCKTELEDALVRGPAAMKLLLERGAALVRITHPPNDPKVAVVDALDGALEDVHFWPVSEEESPLPAPPEVDLECDYCGMSPHQRLQCSRCKIALYCHRECQKGDWKRHRPLCIRYTDNNQSNLGQLPVHINTP